MADVKSQPNTPSAWQDYANSDVVSDVPLKSFRKTSENAGTDLQRDIYLDFSTVLMSNKATQLTVFADVVALTDQETVVKLPKHGLIRVFTRVLTASEPIHLKFIPDPTSDSAVAIYASIIDQPITYSIGSSDPVPLDLGTGSGHVGAHMSLSGDEIEIEYQKRYLSLESYPPEFRSNLEMQLRIALALFWSRTSIAISLSSHVVTATQKAFSYPLINTQAVALGQQLAAQTMTGPDMSYAPVLKITSYIGTLTTALDAVEAFEKQYDRFQDKKGSVETQLAAWATMLEHSENENRMRKNLRESALAKYEDASKAVASCVGMFKVDQGEIALKKINFELGIEEWKRQKKLEAAFKIITGIITFAIDIGLLCVGDPAAEAGAVNSVIDIVKAAEKLTEQIGKFISSKTFKNLAEAVKVIAQLYPTVEDMVSAVKKIHADPDAKIPIFDTVSGTAQGDADAAAIVTLAAWDKWILESDDQLSFAVGQGIGGASAYQLALRKHAINGKQLAQAQAEAIKAGQQYIQAELELSLSQRDIQELENLMKTFNGDKETYAIAEAKFYDRLIALRTSVAIEMRNLTWAYKYYALEDSKVDLDSQKSLAQYREDVATITQEIENADSRYASDDQPFNYPVDSDELPSNYGSIVLKGLKSPSHSASFVLVPRTNETSDFASRFTGGSHFRIHGMEATLLGIKPKPDASRQSVAIEITTSGIYSDIQSGKVYHFTSRPLQKRFEYFMTPSGEKGEVLVRANYPTTNHSEPTPFTQWTIKIKEPEHLDLDSLTGVELRWAGTARYGD